MTYYESKGKWLLKGREGFSAYKREVDWVNRWLQSPWNPVMDFFPYLSFAHVTVLYLDGCYLYPEGWMVREGSFSSNRKDTRAYLIRDLQIECDCRLLEIMRITIYMLIPKLIIFFFFNVHVNTKVNNFKKYSKQERPMKITN